MPRVAFAAALVAASLLIVPLGGAAAARVEWQESVAPLYRIGIRDKFGDLGRYDATFAVTDGRHTWRKTIRVKNDDWGFVLFPDDFEDGTFANFNNVPYKWQATVKGRVVTKGRFTLARPPFD